MKYKLTDAPGQIKDADPKTGVVTGYFSCFGNKDSDGDIIRPGAFTKTILENGPDSAKPRIKHLLDHRTNQSIGRLTVLKEDGFGLYYESQIGSHALGMDFLKMAESGLITEHSIGYSVIKGNPTQDAYELLELKLYEGSSLQFYGANPNTPLTGIKSEGDLLHYLHLVDNQLHKGTLTDETFAQLQAHYDAISAVLKAHKPPTEPEPSTQPDAEAARKSAELIAQFIKESFTL
ncbi:HK97 family phage prohead protease [Spirosoma sp. 209]|uniref:HK97 family phage prohead protease n=1 Tax=Spirosoma sp. 209 TaxID=1955701 RepID=UPI0013747178|nr:HK97 family phage prohead protease [Spirosoma sp. 209]